MFSNAHKKNSRVFSCRWGSHLTVTLSSENKPCLAELRPWAGDYVGAVNHDWVFIVLRVSFWLYCGGDFKVIVFEGVLNSV